MGCDIHIFVEKFDRPSGKWKIFKENHFTDYEYDGSVMAKIKTSTPFNWRSYSMYGFLADVRNYSECEPISSPKGFPDNSEYLNYTTGEGWFESTSLMEELDNSGGYHSNSWLTVEELLEFNYDRTFIDQRNTGGSFGKEITYKEHLGEHFFINLEELKEVGNPEEVRIVFYFDN